MFVIGVAGTPESDKTEVVQVFPRHTFSPSRPKYRTIYRLATAVDNIRYMKKITLLTASMKQKTVKTGKERRAVCTDSVDKIYLTVHIRNNLCIFLRELHPRTPAKGRSTANALWNPVPYAPARSLTHSLRAGGR